MHTRGVCAARARVRHCTLHPPPCRRRVEAPSESSLARACLLSAQMEAALRQRMNDVEWERDVRIRALRLDALVAAPSLPFLLASTCTLATFQRTKSSRCLLFSALSSTSSFCALGLLFVVCPRPPLRCAP
eukprot:4822976-Pleurochrysis_carterae.AAC.1